MNIGTLGNMVVIAQGWRILDFGFTLMKKKDKNAEEQIATKAFSRFFTITCIVISLFVITLLVSVVCLIVDIRVGSGDVNQYEDNLVSGVIGLCIEIFFGVIFLIVWSLVGQGSIGKKFSIFYTISLKRDNPAWIREERSTMYEEQYQKNFAKKQALWLQVILSIMYVLLIIGIATSGTLAFAKVYALLPNQNLVLFSRYFGGIALLTYIMLLIICVKFDDRYRPLYSANNHLLDTQLLMRNEQGQIGYYTTNGMWMELQNVKIMRRDDEMVKMKCFYKASNTGGIFSNCNYIAREDGVYPLVMELAQAGKKRDKRPKGLWWRLLLMLFISILLFAGCLLLLSVRDKNIGGIF